MYILKMSIKITLCTYALHPFNIYRIALFIELSG